MSPFPKRLEPLEIGIFPGPSQAGPFLSFTKTLSTSFSVQTRVFQCKHSLGLYLHLKSSRK